MYVISKYMYLIVHLRATLTQSVCCLSYNDEIVLQLRRQTICNVESNLNSFKLASISENAYVGTLSVGMECLQIR